MTDEQPTTGEPSTTSRDLVRAAWTDLLGISEIDDDDDFFALGGHSLRLVELAERLRAPVGRDVPAHLLLDDPTVVGMADVLDGFGTGSPVPIALGPRTVPTTVWQAHALTLARSGPSAVPAAWAFTTERTGAFDVAKLESALRSLIDRHAALRTFFPSGATLMARCAAPSDVPVPLRVLYAAEANTADVLHDVTRPFDPAAPPLLRAAVLQRDDGWLLGVAASDLVFDALSVPALLRGLERADTDGATSDSTALAKLERTWVSSPDGREAVRCSAQRWRAGAPRIPSAGVSERTHRRERRLTPAAVRGNLDLCRAVRVSPYTTVVAATLLALREVTQRADPAVLVQVSRRDDPDLQPAIGPYENLAVLEVHLDGESELQRVAALVRDAQLEAEAPFETVREHAGALAPPVVRFLGMPRAAGFEWRKTGRPRVRDGIHVSWIAEPSGGALLRLDYAGEWSSMAGEMVGALINRLEPTAVVAR
ncbi:MAG TPA: condensation domain-containing protein [Aldersonia sp.]